jgi:phosphoribosyl 1,2-cyclic phosphate phosphodiesterase
VVKGYPAFKVQAMPTKLEVEQGKIESTLLPHGGVTTLGLAFTERSSGKKFVYYTDCKSVPSEAVALAKGAEIVVLDGLRPEEHVSHMSVSEAVAVAAEIGAKRTFLTHMTHLLEHMTDGAKLPVGVEFSYDGLRISL